MIGIERNRWLNNEPISKCSMLHKDCTLHKPQTAAHKFAQQQPGSASFTGVTDR